MNSGSSKLGLSLKILTNAPFPEDTHESRRRREKSVSGPFGQALFIISVIVL